MNNKIRKGVSWQSVGDSGVILDVSNEILIGLTERGWCLWQAITEGAYSGTEDESSFMAYLSKMNIIEYNGEVKKRSDASRFVQWTESYKPLAFTRSCGLHPAEGGPCLGYPHG